MCAFVPAAAGRSRCDRDAATPAERVGAGTGLRSGVTLGSRSWSAGLCRLILAASFLPSETFYFLLLPSWKSEASLSP